MTKPVLLLIVPTARFVLLHVQLGVAEFRSVVAPSHTVNEPVITDGTCPTVTIATVEQPDVLYVILDVPAATPVTTPVPLTTVATVVVLLLHAPPLGPELNVVVLPTQVNRVPVIGSAPVVTVATTVALQPVLNW